MLAAFAEPSTAAVWALKCHRVSQSVALAKTVVADRCLHSWDDRPALPKWQASTIHRCRSAAQKGQMFFCIKSSLSAANVAIFAIFI